MLENNLICPKCESDKISKNGKIHNEKQNYKCQNCGRPFIKNPTKKYITQETKNLIDRLLLEKISLAGIARVTNVSETWLQDYVNHKYSELPQEIKISQKAKGKLTIQCDEAWSFVGKKGNKQWIWLALDVKTREIVGCYVGDRGETGARGLWNSIPVVYRQCALVYTDFWAAYATIFPSSRHKAVGKETGLTSYIERFNNTLRQRVSRLVRETLSFSKKLENHIGAIWYFIHHYNSSLHI
ncbi:MAG: IS1 family transposase [Prochloraceae cyanobacterium]|nr:IS1 family transposase [Prochloraceae cyanobacterium]